MISLTSVKRKSIYEAIHFPNFISNQNLHPMTLQDAAVLETLKANPGTTLTSNGQLIPYPFPSPADWRDHWIYFLLVDRFNNPSALPNPNVVPCNTYQGGNFAGIRQQLPYLKELGAGAIWLSPVLINPQWFTDYWGGYGIFDFLRIEPRFCSDPEAARLDPSIADKEFRELVDEAHSMGIYVVLDIVLNHTGDLFNYVDEPDEPERRDRRGDVRLGSQPPRCRRGCRDGHCEVEHQQFGVVEERDVSAGDGRGRAGQNRQLRAGLGDAPHRDEQGAEDDRHFGLAAGGPARQPERRSWRR